MRAALIACACAACWTNGELPPPQPPAAPSEPRDVRTLEQAALDDMTLYKDEMCRCHSTDCVAHVMDEAHDAEQRAIDEHAPTPHFTPAQQQQNDQLDDEALRCLRRAEHVDVPLPPPPPPP